MKILSMSVKWKLYTFRKGEAWANLRRPCQEQMLRPAAVSTYVSIISDVASDFVDMFQNEVHIDDLKSAMSKVVTESIYFFKIYICLKFKEANVRSFVTPFVSFAWMAIRETHMFYDKFIFFLETSQKLSHHLYQ